MDIVLEKRIREWSLLGLVLTMVVVANLPRHVLQDYGIRVELLMAVLGVLIVLRPGAGAVGPGAMAALVNALCNGTAILLIRRAHARESAEAFAFWGNAVIAAGTALALPWLATTRSAFPSRSRSPSPPAWRGDKRSLPPYALASR